MPTIPAGFVPVVSNYSFEGPGGVMRTEVGGGSPRYALEWDRGLQKFNVTLLLDQSQFSVWVAFFTHIIKKGAITFDMPLDSGFGTQAHAVNIIPGSYTATRTGGIMTVVSFAVEAESKAYDMTAADAVALIDLHNSTGGEVGGLVARIAKFANVDTKALNF